MKRIVAIVALALTASSATAQLEDWEITMVVDNKFGTYYGTATATSGLIGSGTWSTTYTFNVSGRAPTDYLYVATVSDHRVGQGFLGDFENLTTGLKASTGVAVWEVFPAGKYLQAMGFNMTTWRTNVMPTKAEVDIAIAFATTNFLWRPPDTQPGFNNAAGTYPWGFNSKISGGAEWIWHDSTGGGAPLTPGFNHDEFLVFRLPGAVPTPGTAMLLGLGGLVVARRRR